MRDTRRRVRRTLLECLTRTTVFRVVSLLAPQDTLNLLCADRRLRPFVNSAQFAWRRRFSFLQRKELALEKSPHGDGTLDVFSGVYEECIAALGVRPTHLSDIEAALVLSHGDTLPPLDQTLTFVTEWMFGRIDAFYVLRFDIVQAVELLYWCRTFLAVLRLARQLAPQPKQYHQMVHVLDADCQCVLDAVFRKPLGLSSAGLTPEQLSFVSHDIHTGDLIRVQAFAGTGKTRSLLAYAEKRPKLRFLYLAFNSATARTARAQFPRHVACRTLHSIALHGSSLAQGQELGTIRARDVVRILRGRLPQGQCLKADGPPENLSPSTAAAYVLRTLEKYMQSDDSAIRQVHIPKSLEQHTTLEPHAVADAASALWDIIRAGRTPTGKPVPCPHDAYMKLMQLSQSDTSFEPFDVVLVDEAQDMSRCQTALVMRARRHCGVVIVGDMHQKIYTFRGGSAAAFDSRLYPPTATFELTRSFRFGDQVAALASKILGLKAGFRGHHPRLYGTGKAYVFRTSRDVERPAGMEAPTLASTTPHIRIYRSNARLALDALQLAAKLPLAQRLYLKTSQNMQQSALITLLRDAYALYHGKSASMAPLRDFAAWKELVEHVQIEDGGGDSKLGLVVSLAPLLAQYDFLEQVRRLESRFSDSEKDAMVVMTTVHQAKGLEWDRVVLSDDFSPPFETSPPTLRPQVILWPAQDELNHMYVAITRARSELVIPDGIMHWIAALDGLFRYRFSTKTSAKCKLCGKRACLIQLCGSYTRRSMCAVRDGPPPPKAKFDASVHTLGCLACMRFRLADDEDLEDFVRWIDASGASVTTGRVSDAAISRIIKKHSTRSRKRVAGESSTPLTADIYRLHLENRHVRIRAWFTTEFHWGAT